jgi:hypothetical protein
MKQMFVSERFAANRSKRELEQSWFVLRDADFSTSRFRETGPIQLDGSGRYAAKDGPRESSHGSAAVSPRRVG